MSQKITVKSIKSLVLTGLILLSGCALPSPSPEAVQMGPTTSLTSPTSQSAPVIDTTQIIPFASPPSQLSSTPDLPSSSPSPLGIPTNEAAFTPTPLPPTSTGYWLIAVFDYNQHYLSVDETIHYDNNTTEPLVDLILVVEPNRWAGGFVLDSLTWESGEAISNYELSGDQLHIPLPQPLPSGESVSLLISYELTLPEIPAPSDTTRPVPYGYSQRQTNVVDWYPYIPPYRSGEGWLVHEPWYFGEHQVYDVADYQVEITLVESIQDLVIAASAPAEQTGNNYRYHLASARTFALSASNQYQVQSMTVGDVTIYSYVFPYNVAGGQEALQNTADALALYSHLLAPYPHATMSVVEADFLDGMEYDGLYFLSRGFYDLYDGTPQGYLTLIAAHETAHQWWYGLVGNDQALEPWLDEAMCTYMERIFYERVYPDYPQDSGHPLVDWWWAYRVNFYQPTGWVDGTIYDYSGFRPYRDAVYLNGAKFLEDLRNLIGEDAFFAFLQDYATRNAHQLATAKDFFAILREHTAADMSELLTIYFQSAR
jgi:hypothetical protein